MQAYEFHFAEGFTGQKVVILVDGDERFSKKLQTQFQTGLAHIETLRLDGCEHVVIRIGPDLEVEPELDPQNPFIILSLVGGKPTLTHEVARPGYV